MSAPGARMQSYKLLHDIVRETRDPSTEEEREEVLKEAGAAVWIRRPKAKHLRAFDDHGEAAPIAGLIELIKRTAKLSAEEVENLDAEDFEKLGELVAPGMKNGPKTGDISSG